MGRSGTFLATVRAALPRTSIRKHIVLVDTGLATGRETQLKYALACSDKREDLLSRQ